MFGRYYSDDPEALKRRCKEMEGQLDEMRWRQQQEQERQQQEREANRRAMREAAQREARTADDWDEAFWKSLMLYEEEAGRHTPEDGDVEWWQERIREIRRAQELYRNLNAEAQEQIDALRRALRQQTLYAVADQLQAEFGDTELVEALRDDDYEHLVDW